MDKIKLIIKDCREYLKNYGEAFITEEELILIEKRIKELEDDLYSANCIISDLTDSIPVQKVKDKIEELKKDYEDSKDENGETEYYYPDYTIRKLAELLEDK